MLSGSYLRYRMKKITEWLALKTEMVQHREVIKEVFSSVDRSWVYYIALLTAGLIALLGLLTNSVAVVIGAMLISPLMGPIISSGLAFTIGDLPLARRAFKTISISVALTIALCALVSFLSPLQEPTAEILARVRPNIFDLFVAILSGVVGAVALCTKRNYLITSTGVAVATAVIPPLSVTGYALGTWQPMLALGGFLLFFTNFVAIILSSDLVFFILGFRTSQAQSVQYSPRARFAIISCLLTLISVPLLYTLAVDVGRIKDRKRIERVLKRHLNREQASRLTGYQLQPKGEELRVMASVNTVRFIETPPRRLMEQELGAALKRPVHIELEQLIVASGQELEPLSPGKLALLGAGTGLQPDTPAELSGKVGQLVAKAEQELAQALAPFALSGATLTFAGAGQPLLLSATLRRDYPVSADERLILSRQLERVLEMPVALAIVTTPMLPELRFAGDGSLTPESARELEIVKRLPEGAAGFRFRIGALGKNQKQAESLRRHLARELAVPEALLVPARLSAREAPPAGVSLRIVRR